MPAGGRGYTRVPSLVSIWSSAPFLLNNTLGASEPFDANPSIEARLETFDKSITQLLWPEQRDKDSLLGDRIPGVIDRIPEGAPVYLKVGSSYLPDFLEHGARLGQAVFPWLFGAGGVQIGPIPTGTPIGLLANVNPLSDDPDPSKRLAYETRLAELVARVVMNVNLLAPKSALADDVRRDLIDPLLAVSKCPDLVVNRGHYFGTKQFPEEPALGEEDKRALVEFLKTF
jgi:hypothetical protein